MAEGLFRALVKNAPDYEVQSAGISAAPGQPASQHTVDLLKRGEGVDLSRFRSQALTRQLVNGATHLFVMTRAHREYVEMLFPDAAAKTYLTCEFCPDDDLMGQDVPDPFGYGRRAYEETFTTLKRALPSVHAFIESTWKPPLPQPQPNP